MDDTENTAMNETETTAPATTSRNTPHAKQDAKKSSRSHPVLAVLFLGIAAASAWTSYRMRHAVSAPRPVPAAQSFPAGVSDETNVAEARPDDLDNIWRYTDAVAAARDRHVAEIRKCSENFLQGLRDKGPHRFEHVRAAIPFIRDGFSGFRPVAAVVRDGALDKVRSGDRLQERFNAALGETFIRPCAKASAGLLADCETLIATLDAETAAFCEEVAAAGAELPESVAAAFPEETLKACMDATYGALAQMPFKAGWVTWETASDAAMLPKAICNLALRCCGKTIGKAAVSAAAPAADGPSPIMDIVAVGGFIWTCFDIRELTVVLPEQIEENLTATVDAVQAETLAAIESKVAEATDAYLRAIGDIASVAMEAGL